MDSLYLIFLNKYSLTSGSDEVFIFIKESHKFRYFKNLYSHSLNVNLIAAPCSMRTVSFKYDTFKLNALPPILSDFSINNFFIFLSLSL